MATLTVAQLTEIRDGIGDTCSPYDVSDVTLQALYDDAARANGSIDCVKAYALRSRYGATVNLVPISGELGNIQVNQKHTQIKALMDFWAGICGIGGAGGLTAGAIDLGLDEPCPDGMDCYDPD